MKTSDLFEKPMSRPVMMPLGTTEVQRKVEGKAGKGGRDEAVDGRRAKGPPVCGR